MLSLFKTSISPYLIALTRPGFSTAVHAYARYVKVGTQKITKSPPTDPSFAAKEPTAGYQMASATGPIIIKKFMSIFLPVDSVSYFPVVKSSIWPLSQAKIRVNEAVS